MINIPGPVSKRQEMILNTDATISISGGGAGCVDKDTEFMSADGWKKISEYEDGDLVLQYDTGTRKASFTKPLRYIKEETNGFYKIKTQKGIDQLLSKYHNIIYETSKGNLIKRSADYFVEAHNKSKSGHKGSFITTYDFDGIDLDINEDLLRLQVALKADGDIATESTSRYIVRLKKKRKVERFINLLSNSGIPYKSEVEDKTGFVIFTLCCEGCGKSLSDWMFCSRYYAEIIVDELKYWGGSYYNIRVTDKKDADAVQYFYNILGYNANISLDKDSCYVVTTIPQNKLSLAKKNGSKIDIDFVQHGKYQYCFEVETGALVLRRNGNVFITGNSGKSFLLLLSILRYVDCPFWRGVIFRRSVEALRDPGGLFDEAIGLYMSLPKHLRPSYSIQKLKFTFPSGAELKLSYIDHDKDKQRWHGSQLSFIGWDELQTFKGDWFWYLLSRLRSKSKYPGIVRGTCNPNPDTFLASLVNWWIDDDTGYAIDERAGIIRYLIRVDGKPVWADTSEELIEKYGNSGKKTIRPISFNFIPASIYDNPVVLRDNPDYLANLESLDLVDRERLLHGNWKIREQGAQYFKREWLKKADRIPYDVTRVRAFDKASSEPTKATPKPDYTACIGMAKDGSGNLYIFGDFHTDFCDKETPEVKGRFRKLVGERDLLIERQCLFDDPDQTLVILPRDSGQAGRYEFVASAQKLAAIGCTIKEDPINPHKSKLMRAIPFFSACENGYVYIVESTFNPATLEAYLSELESFDGTRSTSHRHDDWVDTTATAFNHLIKIRNVRTVVRNQIDCATELKKSNIVSEGEIFA